jgi:two-component system, chemotaxis family, chemotaxis protein CheY
MLLCHEEVASVFPSPTARDARGVLLVEDDADIREVVCQVLAGAGYEVRSAGNGREALDRSRELLPLVVLTDWRMPIMDGPAFVIAFRAIYGDGCPIVICSAEENVESLAEEIGADGWLQKPVDLDDLLAAVGRYVGSFVRHAQSTRRRLQ